MRVRHLEGKEQEEEEDLSGVRQGDELETVPQLQRLQHLQPHPPVGVFVRQPLYFPPRDQFGVSESWDDEKFLFRNHARTPLALALFI